MSTGRRATPAAPPTARARPAWGPLLLGVLALGAVAALLAARSWRASEQAGEAGPVDGPPAGALEAQAPVLQGRPPVPAAAPPPPAGEAPVAWSDLPRAVRSVAAPLLVHLRVEADGRVALRSAVPAEAPAWEPGPVVSLAGDEPSQARALIRLRSALEDLLAAGLGACEHPRHWNGSSARVVLDVDPAARWRHVQHLVSGPLCAVGLHLCTWLDPRGGEPIPQRRELDGEFRHCCPLYSGQAQYLEVSLFGEVPAAEAGTSETARPARLRLTWSLKQRGWQEFGYESASAGQDEARDPWGLRAGMPDVDALRTVWERGWRGDEAEPMPDPVSRLLDLPAPGAPTAEASEAWARVRSEVQALLIDTETPLGLHLATPWPRVARLRAGDVLAVLAVLRDNGRFHVPMEGAAAPRLAADAPPAPDAERLAWQVPHGEALRARAAAAEGDGLLYVQTDGLRRLRLLHVPAGAARARRWERVVAADGGSLTAENLAAPLDALLPGWDGARREGLPVLLQADPENSEALARLLAAHGLRRVERLP